MKISEIDELFEKCWKGYEKKGMKTMFGKRVPNCVKKESVELEENSFDFGPYNSIKQGSNEVLGTIDELSALIVKLHATVAEAYGDENDIPDEYEKPFEYLNKAQDGMANAMLHIRDAAEHDDVFESEEHVDEDFSSVSKMQHATTIGELIDAIEPIADELASDMAEIVRAKGVSDNTKRKAYHILNRFIHWGRSSEEPISIKAIKRIPNIGKVSASILADFLETELGIDVVNEDLRAWFGKGKKGGAGGGGWDRYNTKGERVGKCGDSKPGEGKPKCLSKSRAASLRASGGKKAIANAVKRKKAKDPNPNRKGKAKNVNSHPKK